jgi:hypothetical protein
MGSPTHSLTLEHYQAWTSTYEWQKIYEYGYLYAGPLFIHQMSQNPKVIQELLRHAILKLTMTLTCKL